MPPRGFHAGRRNRPSDGRARVRAIVKRKSEMRIKARPHLVPHPALSRHLLPPPGGRRGGPLLHPPSPGLRRTRERGNSPPFH
jgi:hypothetical protein